MRQVGLIKKKEFAATIFDDKTFVIYIASISQHLDFHHSQSVKIALLKADKTPTFVLSIYINFVNAFSKNLAAAKLLEYIRINDYAIDLTEDNEPSYRSLYSLGLVELEILKTYLKIILANGFIKSSKSLAAVPIFFMKKPDGGF